MSFKKNTFALLMLFLTLGGNIFAVNMESTQYRVEESNINVGGKSASSASYDLTTTLGQTAAGQYSSAGYIIKAGFQYIYSIIPFTFTISTTSIDLGTLSPDTSSTQNATLTVDFGSAGTYQVTVEEIGKLRTSNNISIADTACNGGAETCDETTAKLWNSSTAYGFGYNMSGNDVPADFSTSNHYRPFPDRSLSETPSVIKTSTNVGKDRASTIKFKANISSIQEAGTYQTVINFIATPSF